MRWILWPFWCRAERRVRSFWRLFVQAAFFTLGSGVAGMAVGVVVLSQVLAEESAHGRSPNGDQLSELTSQAIGSSWWFGPATAVGTLLVAVLSIFLAGRALDRRPFLDFGFHFGRTWWRDLGFGLVLGAGLMVAIFVAELAAGWVQIAGFLATAQPGASFLAGILGALVTFFCVGIYEEMLSRGYQLRNIAEGVISPWWSPRVAVTLGWALSSAFFGLLHAGNPNATPVSTAFLMAAGLFLGLGFVLTGELAIPIGLHIAWNFFQGPVFGFPVSGTSNSATVFGTHQLGPEILTGGAFGPEGGLIGLAALVAGSLAILWWVRRTRGAAALRGDLARYPRRLSPPPRV